MTSIAHAFAPAPGWTDEPARAQAELAALYDEDQADRRMNPTEFARLSPAQQERLDQRLQAR